MSSRMKTIFGNVFLNYNEIYGKDIVSGNNTIRVLYS